MQYPWQQAPIEKYTKTADNCCICPTASPHSSIKSSPPQNAFRTQSTRFNVSPTYDLKSTDCDLDWPPQRTPDIARLSYNKTCCLQAKPDLQSWVADDTYLLNLLVVQTILIPDINKEVDHLLEKGIEKFHEPFDASARKNMLLRKKR
jgi:hypothetical protein